MTPIELSEAQADLPKIIHQLAPGDELMITENGIPVARLITTRSSQSGHRMPGLWIGKAMILEDDEQHLSDFNEYMN